MIVGVSHRALRTIAILGATLAVACSDLGSKIESAEKAAAFGKELSACRLNSTSWDQYEPCCFAVARKQKPPRDPSFCLRENDPDKPGAMVPDAPAKDGGK